MSVDCLLVGEVLVFVEAVAVLDANALVGSHDILLVTLDTLRYDVAQRMWGEGRTPGLARFLTPRGWQRRHTPGSFTYAAHHAFFAGFLPTPLSPGPHPRLFAARFVGSQTSGEQTCVFDAPDIVAGFAGRGYRTVCIGGVGFFNGQTPLGSVLPDMFQQSYWDETLGVTDPRSTENQVECGLRVLAELPTDQRLFLFVNISALHQPNCIFSPGAESDSADTQAEALCYVDTHLPRLIDAMRSRCGLLAILTSDHGTAYGEDGQWGHRLAHPVVWEVPYAECVLPKQRSGCLESGN